LARLRLSTRVRDEQYISSSSGETVRMPTLRLHIDLHFVSPNEKQGWRPRGQMDQQRRIDAVVDTGAWLTNIEHDRWEPFASEIHWLSSEPAEILRGGSTITYRLGLVLLAASDNQNRWMPPAWTVARCLEYHADKPCSVLGLTSPFFKNNRSLRHASSSANELSDQTQVWWLEDPKPS